MSLEIADRVKETSTTTGTGTLSLNGATTGFQGFVAGIGDTNETFYCITDGTDWEVGRGTVTDSSPDTLSRDTVIASSNSDAKVNWGAGTRDVFAVYPGSTQQFKQVIKAWTHGQRNDLTGTISLSANDEGRILRFVAAGTVSSLAAGVAGSSFVYTVVAGSGVVQVTQAASTIASVINGDAATIMSFNNAWEIISNKTTPINSQGQLITGDAAGQPETLAAGSSGQFLQVQGSALGYASAVMWETVASTSLSGTAPVLVSVLSPELITDVEIHFASLSTDANNQSVLIQLADTGGFETSGYAGNCAAMEGQDNFTIANNTTGFRITSQSLFDASHNFTGSVILRNMGGNVWAIDAMGSREGIAGFHRGVGHITLDGALTIVRATTSAGTASFDNGAFYARFKRA